MTNFQFKTLGNLELQNYQEEKVMLLKLAYALSLGLREAIFQPKYRVSLNSEAM